MSDVKLAKLSAAVEAAQGKLASAQEALAAYQNDQAAEAARLNINEGTEVGFDFGRGETKQRFTGKVVAAVDTPNGRLLKVLAGEGVSLRVYDVRAKDAIVGNSDVDGTDAVPASEQPNVGSIKPVDSQPESDAVAEQVAPQAIAQNDEPVDAATAAVNNL